MAAKVVDRTKELTDEVLSGAHPSRSHVPDHLGLLAEANEEFIKACDRVSAHQVEETEVRYVLSLLVGFSRGRAELGAVPREVRTARFPRAEAFA